jgi:hypothetical protein
MSTEPEVTVMVPTAPPSMPDVLSIWLGELRFQDAYVVLGAMGTELAVRIRGEAVPTFHYVQRGGCRVRVEDRVIDLCTGDLLLMRAGLDRVVGCDAAPSDTLLEFRRWLRLRGTSSSARR